MSGRCARVMWLWSVVTRWGTTEKTGNPTLSCRRLYDSSQVCTPIYFTTVRCVLSRSQRGSILRSHFLREISRCKLLYVSKYLLVRCARDDGPNTGGLHAYGGLNRLRLTRSRQSSLRCTGQFRLYNASCGLQCQVRRR